MCPNYLDDNSLGCNPPPSANSQRDVVEAEENEEMRKVLLEILSYSIIIY
jgi:hypothetical protein